MDVLKARVICHVFLQSKLQELVADVCYCAVEYATARSVWLLADLEKRRELEDSRSRKHTAFIDACNILSRNMDKNGEDNSWWAEIGQGRKAIGDFACYLNCVLGLMGR